MEADTEAFYELLKKHDVPLRHTHCQVLAIHQSHIQSTLSEHAISSHGVQLSLTVTVLLDVHVQTDTMPVNQWQYNEILRQSCSPMPPPAEAWRVAVHDAVSVKVISFQCMQTLQPVLGMSVVLCLWNICGTHGVLLVQILQKPDTFRDEHPEEDQALFDDAARACAAMWAQLKERRGCP